MRGCRVQWNVLGVRGGAAAVNRRVRWRLVAIVRETMSGVFLARRGEARRTLAARGGPWRRHAARRSGRASAWHRGGARVRRGVLALSPPLGLAPVGYWVLE